jgi:hypothetical protein
MGLSKATMAITMMATTAIRDRRRVITATIADRLRAMAIRGRRLGSGNSDS